MEKQQVSIKVKNDLRDLKNGNLSTSEIEVIVCSQCEKISQLSDEKIKSFLRYLFTLIGIKEYPNEAEKMVLLDSVKITLAKFSLEEVKNAFFLAIDKTIDFDLKLYDRSINIGWMAELMKLYEHHRANVRSKYDRLLDEKKEKENKPTPEEIEKLNYETIRKSCLDMFEELKNIKSGKAELRDRLYTEGSV